MDNNTNNSNTDLNKGVEVTETAPKIEVAPIQHGIVQQTVTTGDTIVPTEVTSKDKDKKWFALSIAIVLIVVVLAFLVIIAFASGVKKNEAHEGTIKDNYLVYENPEEGNNIEFKVSDNLTLNLKVTKVDVQEDVGTEVTYTLSVVNGKEKLENRTVWLDDFNRLQVYFDQVGDNVVIQDKDKYNGYGMILDIFYPDKSIKQLSSIDEQDGFYINDYEVKDKTLNVYFTRVYDESTILYYNSDISNENLDDDIKNGFSICSDDITFIDGTIPVNETYTYSLSDNIINLDAFEESSIVTLNEYVSTYQTTYCQ